jgi:hypothetical protein
LEENEKDDNSPKLCRSRENSQHCVVAEKNSKTWAAAGFGAAASGGRCVGALQIGAVTVLRAMLEMQRLDLYHALDQTDARLRLVKSDRRNAIDQTKLTQCLVRSDRELWFGVALFFFNSTDRIWKGKVGRVDSG